MVPTNTPTPDTTPTTRPHIVLVTGDRRWTHYLVILDALKILRDEYDFDTLVHGAAAGADRLAHAAATRLRYQTIKPFPADWVTYGTSAGPRRNTKMLDEVKPDLVLAFHSYIENSSGTKDCVTKATRMNVPVVLVTSKDASPHELSTTIAQKLAPTLALRGEQ